MASHAGVRKPAQKPTSLRLLDHLVGGGEQRRGQRGERSRRNRKPRQSLAPGFVEKCWSLSGFPSHSFQSGGGAFLT